MEANRTSQSKKIKHLHWRAGFGLTPQQWQERRSWSLRRAVNHLFQEAENAQNLVPTHNSMAPTSRSARSVRKETLREGRKRMSDVTYAWLMRMGGKEPASDLLEKMSLFWHGHFACRTKKSFYAEEQLKSIRKYALGNFRDLVLAIAKDPAMLRYLSNQQNRKRNPNENFARELLELFTIGRGHYTERDVKEAARAFTGWASTKEGTFELRRKHHDFGNKTFLGISGNLNGEDIVDQILTKRATAQFICRKIYRYFVNDKVDETRINQLADSFYRSNYNIKMLMNRIFQSDWFYDDYNRANKIKSPTILIAGMVRHLQFNGILPDNMAAVQKALGQSLFSPPNVAGWPGGKNWVNNSTLMLRLQLAGAMFRTSEINYSVKTALDGSQPWQLKNLEVDLDLRSIQALVEKFNNSSYLNELADYLLSPDVQTDRKTILSFIDSSSNESYVKSLCVALMSLPEYQLH